MKKLHFIKAPCHQSSRQQGFQFAPDEIKEHYDYTITTNLFSDSVIDLSNDRIELCSGYNLLYKHILNHTENNPNDIIITIGGDNSISSATVAAMNEKYMVQCGEKFDSDLMVLWIDSMPDIHDFSTSINQDLNEMAVASLLGLCDTYFVKNNLLLKPEQFIYYGLVDKDDNLDEIKELKIPCFTHNKIKSMPIEFLVTAIKNMINNKPLHICLDMKVFNESLVKSTIPSNPDGIELERVEKLLIGLKDNIVSMDITEFNPLIGTTEDIRTTKDTIKYLLMKTFDIKEKKLNIFTEESQFIIYRPLSQEDDDSDIGWYILRGLPLEDREDLLKLIPDDTIISIDIEDDEDNLLELDSGTYLLSKTSIDEQNEKSYYTAESINDTVLFPEEKVCMVFELLASYKQ